MRRCARFQGLRHSTPKCTFPTRLHPKSRFAVTVQVVFGQGTLSVSRTNQALIRILRAESQVATAISRIRPWLASGWGCPGRRLSSGQNNHCGSPIRRSRSANRGSERTLSSSGWLLMYKMPDRLSNAFSKAANVASLSPSFA